MTSAHAAQPSPGLKPPDEPKPPTVPQPPIDEPPEAKPPGDEPPQAKPPVAAPPTKKPPGEDEPVAVPELPKTGAEGVQVGTAVGIGLATTGAALYAASRKLDGKQNVT